MRWCLDTDHVGFALHGAEILTRRLRNAPPRGSCITSIALAELEWSSLMHPRPQTWDPRWRHFIRGWPVLPFTKSEAHEHALIRRGCRHHPIGERDLIIASMCRADRIALVSGSTAEFRRVNGLRVGNWAR